MAEKQLLVTLGLDASTYTQNVKRAKDLNKELDSSFKMLSSSSEGFEKSVNGLGKKQEYLASKLNVANGLTEVYSKRLKESQELLEKATNKSKAYAESVDNIKESMLGVEKGTDLYKKLNKELKSNQQLVDKSEKAMALYNRRILEAKDGYNLVQTEIQKMNKEMTLNNEKLDSMKTDAKFDSMKESSSALRHEFEVLKNSTENFENSMFGLSKTEEYYSNQLKNTKNLMKGYTSDIAKSEKAIAKYEDSMNQLQAEVLELETALKGMSSTDEGFEETRNEAEALRAELSTLSSKVEHHKGRIASLGDEYKKSELEVAKMTKSLKITKKQMKELEQSVNFSEPTAEVDKFANSTLEILQREIKETNKSFDTLKKSVSNFGKTAKDLKTEKEHLIYLMELMGKATEEYNSDINKVNKAINQNTGLLSKQAKHIEKLKSELDGMDKSSKAWDNQKAKIDKSIEAYRNIELRIESYKSKLDSLTKENEDLTNESNKLNGALHKNMNTMKQMVDSVTFKPLSNEIKELTNEAINKLDAQMEVLKDDFQRLSIVAEGYEQTVTGLEQKQTHFNKSMQIAKKMFNEYSTELVESKAKVESLTKAQKELEEEITQQIAKLKQLDGQALDDQIASVNNLKKKYEDVNKDLELHRNRLKEVEAGYKSSRQDVASLNTEFQRTKKQITELNRAKIFDNLDKQTKQLSDSLKILESGFEVTQSKVKNFGRTTQDLARQTEFYENKLRTLRSQMDVFKSSINAVENELSTLNNKKKETIKHIEQLRTKMKSLDESSPKFQDTIQALARFESELNDINADIDKYKSKHNELQVELNQTTTETNRLTREMSELNSTFVANNMNRLGDNLTTIGNNMQQVGQSFIGLSLAIGGIGGAMVKTGTDFTSSMSKVQAVTGATEKDFQALTDTARKWGRETVFTASESADALTYLGLAGYDAQQSIETLPKILQLAQAGALDLATSSDLATDAIASLGYVGDEAVGKLPELLDKVAQTSANANTSVEQMLKAFIKTGGQLDNLNIGLDTSSAMLGVLANRGLKAEEVGTSLNSILINMTKKSGESAEAMEALGVSFFDAKGEIREVEDVMVDLAGALSKLNEKDRVQFINMIGGKTQAKTIQKLLQGMVDDTGKLSDEYKDLKAEIEKAPDMKALENMANTMSDNLGGDFKILTSTIQESFLAIFEEIEPQLREFVQNLTESIKKITDAFLDLSPEAQNFVLMMAGVIAVLPPLLIILGTMSSGLGVLAKGFGGLTKMTNLFGRTAGNTEGKVSFLGRSFKILGGSVSGLQLAIGAGIVALGAIVYSLGENENALAWLMDKWGIFGEFVADICERFAGVVQITFGNIGHLIAGIGKSLLALVSGNWRDIDDIWRETWADMENTTARAMSNIKGESTKALKTIRKASKDDLDYVKLMFKDTLELLPTVTKDNLDQVAQTFTNKFSMMSDESLQIMRGTSDTMAILLDGIVEGMDTTSLNKKLQENIKGLLNAGKLSADELEKDFSKAQKLIADNMVDSYKRASKEAEKAIKEFERFSVLGMEGTAGKVAEVISRMNVESYETLLSMGGTWKQVFDGITADAGLSTEQMKDKIIENLNKLGATTPEGISTLMETLKGEMKNASDMTKETVDATAQAVTEQVTIASEGATTIVENMKNATSMSMDELYKNIVEGVSTMGADTASQLSNSSDYWYSILHGAFDSSGKLSDNFLQVVRGNFNYLNLDTPQKVAEFAKHLEEGMKTANINATEEATKTKENIAEQTQGIADASKDVGLEITENVTPQNLEQKVKEAMQQAETSLNTQKTTFAEEARQIAEEAENKFRGELENMATVEIPDTVLNVEKITAEMGLAGELAVQAFANAWNNNCYIITDGAIATFSSLPSIMNVPFDNLSSTVEIVASKIAILSDTISTMSQGLRAIDMITLSTVIGATTNLRMRFNEATQEASILKKAISDISNIQLTTIVGGAQAIIAKLGEVTRNAKVTQTALENLAKVNFKKVHSDLDNVKKKLTIVEAGAKTAKSAIEAFLGVSFYNFNYYLDGIPSKLSAISRSASSTRVALENLNSVSLNSLLSKLSSVRSALSNVASSAGSARNAIANMNSAGVSASFSIPKPRTFIGEGVTKAISGLTTTMSDFSISNYQTSGGFYSPTSMRGVSSNVTQSSSENELILAIQKQNELLLKLLVAERDINVQVEMDGRNLARGSARYMEAELNKLNKRKNRLGGIK